MREVFDIESTSPTPKDIAGWRRANLKRIRLKFAPAS
jgi:hypothetical protein